MNTPWYIEKYRDSFAVSTWQGIDLQISKVSMAVDISLDVGDRMEKHLPHIFYGDNKPW